MEPVSHPEAALGHLTSSVGFTLPAGEPSAPALARYLDQRRTLLVLDGMEHLASWATHLEELAADTERLAIVATSTRPLASRDETLFLLEGLDLTPAPQDPRTSRCAAVRYFAERARRALPGFTAETDVETVWRVCARVGGLPLGLELAAGFVRVLSLRELAERLEERPEEIAAVTAGVPERHGSLLRVCEHAWSFLDDGERAVLSALSVFRESFAVADLEAVCGPALADLARLERRSLVRGDGDRYALHPLIRRFAAGRLADDPAAETAARDRHAAHFASVMQGLQGLEGGITEGEARRAAERALPDAIAAWRWSVERGAEENLVRLLTFMRSALNAMGRNALIDELIVTGLARVGPLSSAAARLKLALAQQVIHLDRRKARGLATAAAAAAAASDDVVSEGLAVLTLAATEDPSRGLESTRPLVRAALGRLREARSWELVASSYRALAVAVPSPRRHGALLALGMRYMRRFGFLSASTALSYYLGSHLTDTCGDHRAALAVTLEHLRSELDGAARPYALVAIHSLVAYYSLNAGDLDAARQHHEEALELTGRRAEAPEPVYWSPETHWVAWAAPLVALHTAGPGHALRSGRDQLEPREVRDLLAHAMLACGDREGALAAADRWRRRAASLPVVRFRVLAQAISERLQATLACDHEAQRRHLATALRTCARHHLVPMALDCLVSCHRLFPDVVSQEEAVAAATHPAAYHSAPLLLTGFRGPVPAKLARAPYPGTEALRRGAALAERLWC